MFDGIGKLRADIELVPRRGFFRVAAQSNGQFWARHMIGKTRWVIPEGYIPGASTGAGRAFESHETACIVNMSDRAATVRITLFFSDRDPVGPYRINVPAKRTRHLRFNDLQDPAPVPRDTDYSSLIESDIPIVVQHTRLDSRKAELALLSTMAFPAE
jgi:hypothetical protein